ncbi:MAG TPA: hypothetical protein VMS64_06030 [Candidatus Methylomirabilis sp.]|nr:hypothetical protein [Candidatus Methylomirabilis sp.]
MTARSIATLIAMVVGLLAALPRAQAQPAARYNRIGILLGAKATDAVLHVAAFRERLRELGYLEGQNLRCLSRSASYTG